MFHLPCLPIEMVFWEHYDRPFVVNLSQIVTVKTWLTETVKMWRWDLVEQIYRGLELVFDLR